MLLHTRQHHREGTLKCFRWGRWGACVENASIDPYDWEDYAKSILGDDDSATIRAYKRFVIKSGSITRV
jgi:hypothetical protein